jgi:hypothetical protein
MTRRRQTLTPAVRLHRMSWALKRQERMIAERDAAIAALQKKLDERSERELEKR